MQSLHLIQLIIAVVGNVLLTVDSSDSLLKLTLLENTTHCLDGSPAGFYYSAPSSGDGNNKWVIFFEGGGYCADQDSCMQRANTSLGSSHYWTSTTIGKSGYSSSQTENPYFYDSNHVYIPYCTGDVHSGQISKATKDTFNLYFSGHLNVVSILNALINKDETLANANSNVKNDLANAEYILISGSSAGGMGTFGNIDFIADYIRQRSGNNYDIVIKGAPIGGWFFPGNTSDQQESDPMMPPNDYTHYITMNDTVNGGIGHNDSIVLLWDSFLDATCTSNLSNNGFESWHCSSVHNLYPFIETPLFILENKYDNNQIEGEMGMPVNTVNNDTIKYVTYYGDSMKRSILDSIRYYHNNNKERPENGLFFASCFDHTSGIDIANDNAKTTINGYNSSQLVGSWFWELNEYPIRVIDDCIDDALPCNPTCDSFSI